MFILFIRCTQIHFLKRANIRTGVRTCVADATKKTRCDAASIA